MDNHKDKTAAHSKNGSQKVSLPGSIMIAAVVGFGVVSYWRGVWYLWDVLVFPEPEHKLYSALASVITGILILAVMRTFYSVLAPPIPKINIRSSEVDE